MIFVAIYFATAYPFVFTSRINKFLVATLSNQDNKVAFLLFDENRAQERSSEFMKTCHNMKTLIQIKGVDVSLFNSKN